MLDTHSNYIDPTFDAQQVQAVEGSLSGPVALPHLSPSALRQAFDVQQALPDTPALCAPALLR